MTETAQPGFVVWFVGLPGSGKSTLAKEVFRTLKETKGGLVYLQMDGQRKKYFPQPSYTPEERDAAYRMFAQEGAGLAREGKGVILDGTAHERSMRRYARELAPFFIEVYVRCSLEVAMNREKNRPEGLVMADLYEKALERQRTGKQFENLGQVIGVDVPFEEDPAAECVVDNDALSISEGREMALQCICSHLEAR